MLKLTCYFKELFALGMANVVGSFFRCFVSSGSLSRSIVAENSGGKTQVTKIKLLFILDVNQSFKISFKR